MLLTFGAVFAGAGAFALVSTSDTGADGLIGAVAVGFGGFFLLVFGGIGALMMFLGLYSLLNSFRSWKSGTARWSPAGASFSRSSGRPASKTSKRSKWMYTAVLDRERRRRPT